MILKTENIIFIKETFQNMKSKHDFLDLLNYVKPFIYGEKTQSFDLNHLNFHSNSNTKKYKSFIVKKKSGADRTINSPSKGLKAIQKCLNLIFQTIYDVHPSVYGFVKSKSIVNNANIHSGNHYIYNIDLKDFFSSIDQARIWGRLQYPPFNLNKERDLLEVANMISSLCCFKIDVERLDENNEWQIVNRNVLPQGAPTSPTITNIICQQLDFYLTAVAKRFGLRYSRYADDITFSSMHNVYNENSDFIKELNRVISSQNFHIKQSKTRLQKKGYRQEVTGLIVNAKPNVNSRYIKQLRMWLFYWENHGYEKANLFFGSQYFKDRGYVKKRVPNLEFVLDGKLNFLKMVKGAENGTYLKLYERFRVLSEKKISFQAVQISNIKEVKHDPQETVKLLKFFKYDNKYSFKQLVHKPVNENDFNFIEILKTANKQFMDFSVDNNNKLNIPKDLISGVQNLFEILRTSGIDFYNINNLHPLEDKNIGAKIQLFKGDYRFGNEKSESSILSDLIIRTALKKEFSDQINNIVYSFGENDNSGLFDYKQIIFYPELQKFQSKANFFTWVPNVKIALSIIFESILKHSNVNGNRNFTLEEKGIIINIERKAVNDLIKIELSILDKNSLLMGSIDNILSDMRRDFFPVLVGICDFKVQFKSIMEENYECRVLPYASKVKPIDEDPQGFKYIFTFYD
ncbi:reverse transcriptase domain-containing protein [[Flexibacter] sp. ATCC 35103]|uniref:reverse transcriptase domain-containing protein n=1 Tax=[Flexibacter] sp. ATCC 35103 TaxID=1937528 RepID=UPI0009CDE05B|nr:reverse transcriptase domain-containing protein [[Flexibacter] sp. ATCC 35103]OMQ13678.1 hypothetical protein BXU01_04175 [[Flexibacter] sp. ATCC 35103]